ncbi:MAG: hypothetical protein WAO13_00540 [Pseudolabrys sp.]
MGSKTIAKSVKAIAVKKENLHRNANPRTKIAKPTITAKIETPLHPDDKPKAKLKKSIATKIETPQSSQSDDKSNAESKNSIATKIETPQPSQSNGKPSDEENMKSITAKTETLQSSQLDDGSVIKKAKVTIAAKMENPASVEFRQMKRAERKNAVGKSIDSICGYVRGKTASGEETGDRPFLYLVQEDEAYIGGYSIATSPHHNICN